MILGSFGVYDRCIIEWCSSFRALRYLKITIAPLTGAVRSTLHSDQRAIVHAPRAHTRSPSRVCEVCYYVLY